MCVTVGVDLGVAWAQGVAVAVGMAWMQGEAWSVGVVLLKNVNVHRPHHFAADSPSGLQPRDPSSSSCM